MTADFMSETVQVGGRQRTIFKALKEKNTH